VTTFTPTELDLASSPDGIALGEGAALHVGPAGETWIAPADRGEQLVDLPGFVDAILGWRQDPTPAKADPKVKADRFDGPSMFGDMRRESA